MAGKVTSMSVKTMAAAVASNPDHGVNVAAFCRGAGVSRNAFYKWVARCREEGLEGLEDRSRRPVTSPQQTGLDVEDEVVRLRKWLEDIGNDCGATTIHTWLGRDPALGGRVPSIATIHRILVRRGQVTPAPRKRPKSSYRRFEAPAPNEWWQIDATDWVTATGVARVFNIIDDHSRVAICSLAVPEATTHQAWAAFSRGAAQWGLPAGMLSDNGLCFSGKLRGFEVFFEAQLRDAGIRPITGKPYHPQTTGKVERFQQTLKKSLRQRPLAGDLVELQHQLDEFCEFYNHHRPHQGIGRVTPISRFNATQPATASVSPLAHPVWPTKVHRSVVNRSGVARAARFSIHVGARWEGHEAITSIAGTNANVFINGTLIRHLELDPDRDYQPSRTKRGGPHQPRLP
jgi:transposase InsO family protein